MLGLASASVRVVNLKPYVSSAVSDPVAGNNSAVLSLAPSAGPGPGDAGDIPTLPTWALWGLGAGLLWRLQRHRPSQPHLG